LQPWPYHCQQHSKRRRNSNIFSRNNTPWSCTAYNNCNSRNSRNNSNNNSSNNNLNSSNNSNTNNNNSNNSK